MSQAQLDQAFARAASQHDGEYAVARAEILRDPGAHGYLEQRRDHATSDRERLTAETLLGWLDHQAQYDEAQAWVKDESRRRTKTVLGRASPAELGVNIAALGTVVTPRVLEMWCVTHEYEDSYEAEVLVFALRELRDPRAFDPALALLHDRGAGQARREQAVLVLQGLRDARALPVARALLLDPGEPDELRYQAARVLLELKSPDARVVLEQLLFDPALGEPLRRQVALLLYELRDPASLPALERAAQTSHDESVLGTVCLTIGVVGDRSHIPLLKQAQARTKQGLAHDDCSDAIAQLEGKP